MRKQFGTIATLAMVLVAGPAFSAEPLPPGTISVEPAAFEADVGSSMPAFVEAVGTALAAREFTLLGGTGHGRFVADLRLSRVEVGTTTAKVKTKPVAFVPGGTPFQANGSVVGGGLNFLLPTSKSKTVSLQQTRLEIRIMKRGENTVLWQGTAVTVRAANTLEGQDSAVASALSEAIFRSYPAQSDDPVSVP